MKECVSPPEKSSSSTDSTNWNLRTASPSPQARGTTAPQNLASPPSRPQATSRKTTHQKHVPLPAPNLAMLPPPGACSNLQTLSRVLRLSKATVNYDQKSCHFCKLARPEGNELDSRILQPAPAMSDVAEPAGHSLSYLEDTRSEKEDQNCLQLRSAPFLPHDPVAAWVKQRFVLS